MNRLKPIWMGILISGVLFAALFSTQYVRPLQKRHVPPAAVLNPSGVLSDRNTWKNIYQHRRKIGVAHATLSNVENGYRLTESLTEEAS